MVARGQVRYSAILSSEGVRRGTQAERGAGGAVRGGQGGGQTTAEWCKRHGVAVSTANGRPGRDPLPSSRPATSRRSDTAVDSRHRPLIPGIARDVGCRDGPLGVTPRKGKSVRQGPTDGGCEKTRRRDPLETRRFKGLSSGRPYLHGSGGGLKPVFCSIADTVGEFVRDVCSRGFASPARPILPKFRSNACAGNSPTVSIATHTPPSRETLGQPTQGDRQICRRQKCSPVRLPVVRPTGEKVWWTARRLRRVS